MALDVQFWYTTAAKLEGLSVKDGQIIALADGTGYFYDMGGRRYRTNNLEYVATLPDPKTLAQLKAAVETNSQTDNNAVLDLLYITPNGIFRYNGATTEEAAAFDSLLPVDVKEAPNDGYVYSRQHDPDKLGSWTRLRWIFASDSEIPVEDVNTRISALLEYDSASIKLAGTLNLSSNLEVKVESANKTLYIDMEDTAFTGTKHIKIVCVENSAVYLRGHIACEVEITGVVDTTGSVEMPGDGDVTIQDAKLGGNVTAAGFAGALNIHNCKAAYKTIEYTHKGEKFLPGCCLITGCNFVAGRITVPDDTKCKSLIQGNIFDSTEVFRGGLLVEAFYNNEGWMVM